MPPPLVAANRAETAAVTQANVFGQYTPSIAQLEAQYGEMWAQDTAAMYGYAGQSAAAAKVTPFAAPAATTNPAGTANQAAAVSQATGTSAADEQPAGPVTADLVSAELAAKPRVARLGGLPRGHRDSVPTPVRLLIRDEYPAHESFGVFEQLLAVCELLLQHRGSAVLQCWYG